MGVTALVVAKNILAALEVLIEADSVVKPLITTTNSVIASAEAAGRDITSQEWAALDAQRAALANQLNQG